MVSNRYLIDSYEYLATYNELNIYKFTITTNNENILEKTHSTLD